MKRALLACVVLSLGINSSARADDYTLTRPASSLRTVGLGFMFKGGPYQPQIDRPNGSAGGGAFPQIYGESHKPLFDLGIDVQLWRGFGTFGVGGTFGFMQYLGHALRNLSGTPAADTTVFNQLPLTLEAFYRFDWLADHLWWFPLVPYARAGLAYHLWWTTTGVGDVSHFVANPTTGAGDAVGRGGKWGYTGTLGVALLLNSFDSGASRSLNDSTSVRGVYLFGEVQTSQVDGFGGHGFNLSDSTWNLGFYFEL